MSRVRAGITVSVDGRARGIVGAVAVMVVALAAGSPPVAAQAGASAGTATTTSTIAATGASPSLASSSGHYAPLTPFRICDTRPPGGGIPSTQCNTGAAPIGPLGAGTPRPVNVTNIGGVPAEPGVSAVVVNVTAIGPSAGTVLTLYPDGGAKSNTSNLNPAVGTVVANLVEVAVGSDGKIDVLNGVGTVNLAIDVEGYVSSTASGTAGLYNPTAPTRVCDTRTGRGIGANQCNASGPRPITPSTPLTFNVSTGSAVPTSGVSAVVFNLTAIAPTANTVLTAYAGGTAKPTASNVNLVAGAVVPNRVIVPVPTHCTGNCTVTIYNSVGSVNVAVDIDGWFTNDQGIQTTGALFSGVIPSRLCDTRYGNSNDLGCAKAAVPAQGTLSILVAGLAGIPTMGGATQPLAVVINVTAVAPTAATFVTVYSSDLLSAPNASDLNAPAGHTTTNLVVVQVGADGRINLFNDAGSVNLIVDVLGYYSLTASSAPTYQGDIFNAGGVAPMYPAGGGTDSSGTMFIADSGGSRVDEISSSGSLSYIVPATGPPLNNPRSLSLDVADSSVMWITDTGNNGLVEMTTAGSVLKDYNATSSPALTMMSPFGNDNDSTGVYVADTYDSRIIKVNKATGAIIWAQTTCATAMSRPRDVAVGSDGNIYADDTDNNRVVELNPSTGACITSWTGSAGPTLHQPRAITSDGAGGLWIAEDGQTPAITHYTDAGVYIGSTTNTGAGGAGFIEPEGVFLDGSKVVAADPFANQIVTFTVSSGVPAAAGTALNKGGPVLGGFNNPFGVAYAPNGDCFVTDMFNQRIEKFTGCTGTPIATGNFGGGPGEMQNPRGISVSPDGSTVILTNSEDERIDFFSASTLAYESSINPVISTCGSKNLFFPHQVAYDSANNSYWVADTNNNRIVDLSAASGTLGDCLANWTGTGTVVKAPRGIAWDGTNVWVSNAQTGQILKCTTAGACTIIAARTSTPTTVNSPWNLTIHNGDLYIADDGAGSIVVMNMTAPYSEIEAFGTPGSNPSLGELGSPRSVSVSPLNGEIAVADFENNDISFWK